MASERQIAANRANSKRSTGPKTSAGRLTSSRNALKHGLCRPSLANLAAAEAIAYAQWGLVGTVVDSLAVRELALAKLELSRIRRVRTDLVAALLQEGDSQVSKRLKALERYERQQTANWKGALRGLTSHHNDKTNPIDATQQKGPLADE